MNDTDRKLLRQAAIAAFSEEASQMLANGWNPLINSGDALELAVKLHINIEFEERNAHAWSHIVWCAPCFRPLVYDPVAATRRAIVMSAAARTEDIYGCFISSSD